jgi:hypothetical protein
LEKRVKYTRLLGEEPNDPVAFPYELMTGSGLDDNFWLCNDNIYQVPVIIYNAVEAGLDDAGSGLRARLPSRKPA